MQEQMGKAKGLSLECIELNAAGIDVGATEIFVAVPPDRDPQPVRRFPTFTADLRQMAAWLVRCHITTVAMESTGVYWIPPHEILEEAGSRSRLGSFYRSMRARLGGPQAITATAHKLARIVYHLLTTGQSYDETVFLEQERKQTQRHEKRLRNQAKELGFQLIPIPA